jgi:hypothetical protein
MPMGWVSAFEIRKAVHYLLETLKEEGKVPYYRFYDGRGETNTAVVKSIGYPEKGDDYEPDSPELLLDLAAGELEHQAFVKLTKSSTKLADGEPNYLTNSRPSAGR